MTDPDASYDHDERGDPGTDGGSALQTADPNQRAVANLIALEGEAPIATRVKAAWGDWIAQQGPWHVFGALTYDPGRPSHDGTPRDRPVAPDVARAHVRRWLRQSHKLLGGRLEAGVVALEYQKNGWPHFHPLLRLAGGLRGDEFRTIGPEWFTAHGYAKLEAPRSTLDVSAYASKYLVKDLAAGDVAFWPLAGGWPAHQPRLS